MSREIGCGTKHDKPYRSGYVQAMDDVIDFQDDSRASGLNESQKMMLWHMRDYYTVYRGANGFTSSLYFTIESLIAFDGRHYEKYGKFSVKERVQIMQVFINWALEQEETE
ncbi:hypothetical protein HB834_05970 [Listeria booriae]|uniref:hypothetical protein n=1 Tax=Listeria booriae TaxID=1552123 RepID=UPI00164DF029|nr:hypothetical protein [Listeria booriae]MBC6151062.1 hypothetical protein [Listeria booriae]MBC6151189.1 hypothetical protein [Listeria booriae]